MCGIAGWIDWSQDLMARRPLLEAMSRTMACRGPDAEGVWLSRHAGLANRRLFVFDLAQDARPMLKRHNEQTFVIVHDGGLYNSAELRRELTLRGHTFRTRSDAEVLLTAYIEWGEECPRHLHGAFAFAVWDEANQTLFACRDRLGVKPLFYAERGDSLLFGSELKALLAHPTVEPQIDAEGLAEVFALGPARTPGHGVYRHIYELKPGHSMRFDRAGLRIHRYWSLESRPHTDDMDTTVETLRELFIDAVERQLVADAPVCTMLSGGLDSSAISAVAAHWAQRTGKVPFHTYSVDYKENERFFAANAFQPNSDSPWIELMVSELGTTHHAITIDTPELVGALVDAIRARDLPGMADIDSSLLLFCRAIRELHTVALSGEAADEVFGGYPWYRRKEALEADTFPWSLSLENRTTWLSPDLQRAIRPAEYVARRYREALDEVPRLEGEPQDEARLREINYLNITRFMPTLLDRSDRMGMAAGLEVRVPFCDHRLIEYAWNIPWHMKQCDGREKGILRRALQGLVPDEIITRKKSPYPKTHHPKYYAAVRDTALEILSDPASPLQPLVNAIALRELAQSDAPPAGRPWFGQLMDVPQLFAFLIQVDTWLREYRVEIC